MTREEQEQLKYQKEVIREELKEEENEKAAQKASDSK